MGKYVIIYNMEVEKYNQRILRLLSLYLNDYSDMIKED